MTEKIKKMHPKEADSKEKAKKEKEKIIVTIPEITREDTGNLSCTLTIKVVEGDYVPKVEDILNGYRKRAVFKGFRKGKVPIVIIQKMYGAGVKAEEINKAVQAALNKYIADEKLKLFGSPLMKKEDGEEKIDWEYEKEFTWRFDIGLQPPIPTKVTPKDKFARYTIKIDDKLIDKYISDIKKKHGVMTSPEEIREQDIAYCQFQQVDEENKPIPQGVKNVGAISIKNVKDKLLFLGLKKSETIWLKPNELTENINDLSKIFNTDVEKMKILRESRFAFTVLTINRMIEAEIGQKLFDSVYGVGKIKTEDEFRSRVGEDAGKALSVESDNMLTNDVIKYYVEKAKFTYPDEFLKEWLLRTTKGQVNESNLEESYERYKTQMSWNMVEHRITIDNNIKVNDNDIKEEMKKNYLEQAKVRNAELNDKQLEELILKAMSDSKQRKAVRDFLHNEKFITFIKNICKIKEKKVSYDEFYKISKKKKK